MASIGPELPPHLQAGGSSEEGVLDARPESNSPGLPSTSRNPSTTHREEDDEEDDYAPSLPPDLLVARSAGTSAGSSRAHVIGPPMPSYPPVYSRGLIYDEDDSDDEVGPRPLPSGMILEDKDGVQEFIEKEERRRKEVEDAAKPKALKRDEWMLVPPTSSDLLGSLDTTKLKARQFARTAAPAKVVDNSLWTETPAERQQRIADEVSGKKRRAANAVDEVTPEEALEARKKQKRDEEIRRSVEQHTRKVRGSTLVDNHASSSNKGEEEKPAGIWDHSRDMSLGGRLMDDGQRSKMLRDAKKLGDRFGTGKSGGFL